MHEIRTKHLEALEGLSPAKLGGAEMHCMKRLGERVMSRTFERQVNELHIRGSHTE